MSRQQDVNSFGKWTKQNRKEKNSTETLQYQMLIGCFVEAITKKKKKAKKKGKFEPRGWVKVVTLREFASKVNTKRTLGNRDLVE